MTITTKAVTTAAATAATREFIRGNPVARKSAKSLNVSEDLLNKVEALEATPEEVDRVAASLATFGDFLREALGQEKPDEADVAEKDGICSADDNRDLAGRATTKLYTKRPSEIIAEKNSERADNSRDLRGDGRDGYGRSTKKVFS